MKEIIDISTSAPSANFNRVIDFEGERYQVFRYGTNFDIELMKNLIKKFDGKVDVISISGLPENVKIGKKIYAHPELEELKSLVKESMVATGKIFKDIYVPWAIGEYAKKNPTIIKNKKIGFYAGVFQKHTMHLFNEISNNLIFADPYFGFSTPLLLKGPSRLETFLKLIFPFIFPYKINKPTLKDFTDKKLSKSKVLKKFLNCDVFVGNTSQLELLKLNNLKGKTFIIDFLNADSEFKLKKANVTNIINCMPEIFNLPGINFPLLEAIFLAYKDDPSGITEDDIFGWINKFSLRPQIQMLDKKINTKSKFAFIIHPLSINDLFRHPSIKAVKPFVSTIEGPLEKMIGFLPGSKYGQISGIKSISTGKEVYGDIYTIFETPKMLLKSNPEKIYEKLVNISIKAKSFGAQIIGLGAYTKIVGDAGVTISKRSPIPVTTGNSLSAAATLWAADFATKKMQLVPLENNIYQGTLMIIGATGSIGKVSAKLLSKSWKKIILIAPRAYKLLSLVDDIKELSPQCEIVVATNPNNYLSEVDLMITTTSAQGKKLIDISKVKPGCVICDVSRPFDIKKEDAITRPDVLVIASGEVELPGEIKLSCDIGLERNVVYACLAETALLALEERFESFTLSRNISYQKVREIDQLARKHGVRLSAIMGHDVEITNEEIDLCRKHALKKLNKNN